MRKLLVIAIALALVSPLAALAAGSAPAAGSDAAEPPQGAGCALQQLPGDEAGSAIVEAPLLGLMSGKGVAQAGCSDFTPCDTAYDCPCDPPECACVPVDGCRFDNICLCYTYCFGGAQP